MDWYNMVQKEKMYNKFLAEHSETVDEVEKLLNGDRFEDFCLACNYLLCCRYKDIDKIGGYRVIDSLVDTANKRARQLMGIDVSMLFDKVVSKSEQELWGGDELYKLFAYDLPSYYVRSCIKSTLYVISTPMEHMTVDDCLVVARYIHYPPSGDIYHDSYSDPDYIRNKVREKECKAWNKIAEFLFHGNIEKAYQFIKVNDEFKR